MQFENVILELEKEKRKEYLECWRDLMFLKKYLLSAFKEYWDLIKKREVLSCNISELYITSLVITHILLKYSEVRSHYPEEKLIKYHNIRSKNLFIQDSVFCLLNSVFIYRFRKGEFALCPE